MFSFVDKLSYEVLIIIAIFMLLAPFSPMPHALEKLIMLKNGTLKRPLDIFDLFMHLTPMIILLIKLAKDYVFRSP